MNGKKAKKLRKQFKNEFGRSPEKAKIGHTIPLAGQRSKILQSKVDEFRQYKKNK
jgi:hypothetical protein